MYKVYLVPTPMDILCLKFYLSVMPLSANHHNLLVHRKSASFYVFTCMCVILCVMTSTMDTCANTFIVFTPFTPLLYLLNPQMRKVKMQRSLMLIFYHMQKHASHPLRVSYLVCACVCLAYILCIMYNRFNS